MGSEYAGKKAMKRWAGIGNAADKLAKEEVVTEVSKNLMRNYVIKAAANASTHASQAGFDLAKGDKDFGRSSNEKRLKRLIGVVRGTSKLAGVSKVPAKD